jgi:arylsulfatase A-like enzyme
MIRYILYLLAFVVSLEAAPRPNVIFFLVDDYDKPETSVYGGKVLTPNLDRMAREGMTFHNLHMSSTVCTPSRYTCLTGRYAGSSTSPVFLHEFPKGQQSLPAFNVALENDNMNVAAVLAQSGYATGYVGKYHVGPEIDETNAADYGLAYLSKQAEYSEAVNKQAHANEKQYRELIKQRGFTWAKNIYWGNMAKAFKGHNPEWTIQAALEFVEAHKEQPFYLHYCTTLLHGPNGEWYKSLDKPLVTGEGRIKEPLNVLPRQSVKERIEKAGLTPDEAGYLWMDDSLGLLLDKLDKLGIADNTIVVFTADHGSNQKGSLYTARGTSVPCLIRWPKGIKPGTESHELLQNCDFVPTWFELAGAKVPKTYRVDGVSIAPLFGSPDKPVRDYAYCEMGASRAVKTKDWSYMALRFSKDQVAEMRDHDRAIEKTLTGLSGGISRGRYNPNSLSLDQLYRTKDLDAERNLAESPEYKEQLQHMKGMLTQALKRFPDRPFGEFIAGGNATPPGSYDDVLRKMRSLTPDATKQQKKKKPRDQKRRDQKKR